MSGWACRALAAFLCAVIAGAMLPAPGTASRIATQKRSLGAWRLEITKDRFSAESLCRLRSRNHKMLHVAHAVGFRMGRRADVLQAAFRIDGGEPQRWRDQLPELARLKVAIDGRDMDRPTDGIVWLPASLVEDAGQVAIQARPGKRAKTFRMRGFAGLREIGRERGCAPEARFVR